MELKKFRNRYDLELIPASHEGIILGTRKHGETSVILETMTAKHGRHLGLVRGGSPVGRPRTPPGDR